MNNYTTQFYKPGTLLQMVTGIDNRNYEATVYFIDDDLVSKEEFFEYLEKEEELKKMSLI